MERKNLSFRNIIFRFLKNSDLYLAMGTFIFVAFSTFFFVIARYVYSMSVPALEEINIIVFIWFLYFSMIYSLRINSHIRVNIIDYVVSKRVSLLLTIIADIIFLMFNMSMAFFGAKLVYFNFDPFGARSIMLGIPDYVVYAILPLSFIVFSVLVIIQLRRSILNLRSDNS